MNIDPLRLRGGHCHPHSVLGVGDHPVTGRCCSHRCWDYGAIAPFVMQDRVGKEAQSGCLVADFARICYVIPEMPAQLFRCSDIDLPSSKDFR